MNDEQMSGGDEERVLFLWTRHELWSGIASLIWNFLIILWPAIKTLACMTETPPVRFGTWSVYWVGAAIVIVAGSILESGLKDSYIFPFIQIIAAVVLSFNQGKLISKFAIKIVMHLYAENAETLSKSPSISEGMTSLISFPMWFLTELVGKSFDKLRGQING